MYKAIKNPWFNQVIGIKFMRNALMSAIILCANLNTVFANQNKIISIVNQSIITKYDLENRLKVLRLFNLVPADLTQDLNKALKDQLILESLLEQNMEDKIPTSQEEVIHNINIMEKQNNLPQGYFKSMLPSNGISYTAFEKFVKANIVRTKFMSMVGRSLKPTKDEILNAIIANPNNCTLTMSAIVIEYSPKIKNNVIGKLSRIKDSTKVFDLLNKVKGVKATKVDYSLDQIKNSDMHSILMSLSENTYSKPITITENGIQKQKVIFLTGIKFDLDNQTASEINASLINHKSSIALNKVISQLKSSAVIINK